jgi:hypothetical protein
MKGKVEGYLRDILLGAGERERVMLESPQASAFRPNTGGVKLKTLGLLETAAWDRGSGIVIY